MMTAREQTTRIRGRAMRSLWAILAAVLVVCFAAGCGGDQQKGQYRDKDKPRATDSSG
jgi:hypothetical protein